jgi:hypothetical protein
MQRRNVHQQGARSPPPLVHPVPQHVVRPDSFSQSPPLTSLESPPPGSPPKPSALHQQQHPRSQQVAGTAGDYQRFSSPPVPHTGANGYGGVNGYMDLSSPPQQAYAGGHAYGQPTLPPQGMRQQPPPQQQQQWQGQAGMGGWANDATAQMGMQFGKSAVMAGSDYVERNVRALSFSKRKGYS